MSQRTPSCLEGAGMLGHTWVATLRHNGDERIYCQASFGADVARSLDKYKGSEAAGELYEAVRRTRFGFKWAKRSRAAALLDQPPGRSYEPAVAEGGES